MLYVIFDGTEYDIRKDHIPELKNKLVLHVKLKEDREIKFKKIQICKTCSFWEPYNRYLGICSKIGIQTKRNNVCPKYQKKK